MSDLHDATLLTVLVHWDSGIIQFVFDTFERTRMIQGTGLTAFSCPRAMTWGPSVSVLKCSVTASASALQHLSLEMQSGDVLEATAAHFAEV
jgi:hypothetical protein